MPDGLMSNEQNATILKCLKFLKTEIENEIRSTFPP